MSGSSDAPSEREDIEMLLPWYAMGRLDAADRARVVDWLARDPALARQLALIEEERVATVQAAESLPVPARLSANSIASRPMPSRAGLAGLIERMTSWFDDALSQLSPAGLRWAAAGALMLIAVQGIGVGVLLRGAEPIARYETASGETGQRQAGTFAVVRLVDGAHVALLGQALRELGLTIAHGPTADGLYRIRLGPADLEAAKVQSLLAQMRARSDVFGLVLAEPARRPSP